MMELGKRQTLKVVKKVDFGIYLGDGNEKVLLPKKQVPEGVQPGDELNVFLYRDSDDRLIATTREPKIELGGLAVLDVVDAGEFGAFLDWGLEKDLFLPFRQQTGRVAKGDRCLVSLYIDKSGRLCATMKVYELLRTDSPYQKDDIVQGIVYDRSGQFGIFVAVDGRFSALIPKKDAFDDLKIGQAVTARVAAVKPDGKLDLSMRDKIPAQMEKDAALLLSELEKRGGVLPFTDKADAQRIKEEFHMSKNAFKRAAGRLLKEKKIRIGEKDITLIR